MHILIFDNDNFDRAKAIAQGLYASGVTAWVTHSNKVYDHDGNHANANPKCFALVLYHQRNLSALTSAQIVCSCVVSYSGGAGADIPRLISHDGFTQEEAKHIAAQIAQGAEELGKRVLAFWRDRGNALALRLLCEAWEFTKGVACKSENGTEVNAPTEAAHWLAPFGKQAAAESAAEIAAMMGGAAEQAKTFLTEICAGGAKPLTEYAHWKTQITSLREALTKAAM